MLLPQTVKKRIRPAVENRLREFHKIKEIKNPSIRNRRIFNELCFCILTANFSAERSMKIEKEINFNLSISEEELALKLKRAGHRFPNTRAKYITLAREKQSKLFRVLGTLGEKELREWLVKNIKGLGYKEASHFLRNIGYDDFAIIDFHIIDLLVKNKLIDKERPKLKKQEYLRIEEVLRSIAKKNRLSLGALDLYLWYMETGKVLK